MQPSYHRCNLRPPSIREQGSHRVEYSRDYADLHVSRWRHLSFAVFVSVQLRNTPVSLSSILLEKRGTKTLKAEYGFSLADCLLLTLGSCDIHTLR